MKSNQLQKLTFENMSHILDSNDLKVMSELDVFAATLKWIMYDHSRCVYCELCGFNNKKKTIRFLILQAKEIEMYCEIQ